MEGRRFTEQLAALPRQRTQVLPALLLAQESYGWVSDEAIREISIHLRLTVNDVESVMTSYPELRQRAPSRVIVRVCNGASCWINGSDAVRAHLESFLGIEDVDSPLDGGITMETTPCFFACAVAPVIEINGELHGRVDPNRTTSLVRAAMGLRESE